MQRIVRKDVVRKLVYGLFSAQKLDYAEGRECRSSWAYDTKCAHHEIKIDEHGRCLVSSIFNDHATPWNVAPAWVYIDKETNSLNFGVIEARGFVTWRKVNN